MSVIKLDLQRMPINEASQDIHEYNFHLLRQILHDVRADKRTYIISKGLFKTSPKAAQDYANGYTSRVHCQKVIVKSYEN